MQLGGTVVVYNVQCYNVHVVFLFFVFTVSITPLTSSVEMDGIRFPFAVTQDQDY